MPAARRRAAAEPPLVEHPLAVAGAGRELAQPGDLLAGQHQIVEADHRRDAAGAALELGRVLRPRAGAEVGRVTGSPRSAGLLLRRERRARDLQRAEPELGRLGGGVEASAPRRRRGSRATSRALLGRRQADLDEHRHAARRARGSSEQVPYSTVGQPSSAKARTAGAPRADEHVERPGDETRAPQARLAARAARDRGDVGIGGEARRSSDRRPGAESSASAATASPAAEPSRASRRYASARPAPQCARERGRVAAGGRPRTRRARAAAARRGRSSPSRYIVTRSGTRRPRVRNGRSVSSISTRPGVDQRRAGLQAGARWPPGQRHAGELEREPDARAAAADVVVQVAVERLEARVEVGRERRPAAGRRRRARARTRDGR